MKQSIYVLGNLINPVSECRVHMYMLFYTVHAIFAQGYPQNVLVQHEPCKCNIILILNTLLTIMSKQCGVLQTQTAVVYALSTGHSFYVSPKTDMVLSQTYSSTSYKPFMFSMCVRVHGATSCMNIRTVHETQLRGLYIHTMYIPVRRLRRISCGDI